MDRVEIGRSIVERVRAAGDRGLTYAEWALASGLDSRTASSVWEEMIRTRALVKLGQRRGRAWAFGIGQPTAEMPASRAPSLRRKRAPSRNVPPPRASANLEARIRSLCMSYTTALIDVIRRAPVGELRDIVSDRPRRR